MVSFLADKLRFHGTPMSKLGFQCIWGVRASLSLHVNAIRAERPAFLHALLHFAENVQLRATGNATECEKATVYSSG